MGNIFVSETEKTELNVSMRDTFNQQWISVRTYPSSSSSVLQFYLEIMVTVQFSSVQDGGHALGKAHIHSTPSLRSFLNVVLKTVQWWQYWAVQAGLLTLLTFARHRLSPLAAFTSGAYILYNGRRWQWICEFYTVNFKGIFGGP